VGAELVDKQFGRAVNVEGGYYPHVKRLVEVALANVPNAKRRATDDAVAAHTVERGTPDTGMGSDCELLFANVLVHP